MIVRIEIDNEAARESDDVRANVLGLVRAPEKRRHVLGVLNLLSTDPDGGIKDIELLTE